MVLLLVFMQLTRDLFAIAKFLFQFKHKNQTQTTCKETQRKSLFFYYIIHHNIKLTFMHIAKPAGFNLHALSCNHYSPVIKFYGTQLTTKVADSWCCRQMSRRSTVNRCTSCCRLRPDLTYKTEASLYELTN